MNLGGWNFYRFRACVGFRKIRQKRLKGFPDGALPTEKNLHLVEDTSSRFCELEPLYNICLAGVMPSWLKRARNLGHHQIKKESYPKSGDNSDSEPFSRSGVGWIVTGNHRTKNG